MIMIPYFFISQSSLFDAWLEAVLFSIVLLSFNPFEMNSFKSWIVNFLRKLILMFSSLNPMRILLSCFVVISLTIGGWMMPTALMVASSSASACGLVFDWRVLSGFSFNARGSTLMICMEKLLSAGEHCPASEVFPETAHCNPVRAGGSAFPTGKAKFCLVSTPARVYNVYRKRLSAGEVCLHGRDNEGE